MTHICGLSINKDSKLIVALIDFYGYIGCINKAQNIFDSLPNAQQDIFVIGTMMKCLINCNKNEIAIDLYEMYNGKHNNITNMLYINACKNVGKYDKGYKLIDSINIKNINIEFINNLIDFYGKSENINDAINIFNSIPDYKKTIVSNNSMMNAYIYNKYYDKLLNYII